MGNIVREHMSSGAQGVSPEWASFCASLSGMGWKDALGLLNSHLSARTYLSSRQLDGVDELALSASKVHKGFVENDDQQEIEFPHYSRWFLHCSALCTNLAPPAAAGKGGAKAASTKPEEPSNPLDLL